MTNSNDSQDWRQIPDHPAYEVSNTGLVRSLKWNKVRLLNLTLDPRYGYLQVGLYTNGKTYMRRVHRLVLRAFVGEPTKGQVGCHSDGNPLNNNLSNLRWDTQQGNYQDAVKHGTASTHSKHGAAKLNLLKANTIRQRVANGESRRAMRLEYGVGKSTIEHLLKGDTWVN